MAVVLDDIATELETAVSEGTPLNKAVQTLVSRLFKEHMPVVFNGNGYTAEWQEEATRRGLPNYKDAVSALTRYSDQDVMDVFLRHGVLSEREILARQEILLEAYTRTIHVETKLVENMGRSIILPAALEALRQMAGVVAGIKQVSGEAAPEEAYYRKLRGHVHGLMQKLDELEARRKAMDGISGTLKHATAARDELVPLMAACRAHADALEVIMDDALWPLPKYGELLWRHC
jgi:glutamine synthetase